MQDTIVTITKNVTLFRSVQDSLDGIHWLLLFLGWLVYWMSSLKDVRKVCPPEDSLIGTWWSQNNIEVPLSAFCCLILAIWSKEVPTSLIDMRGYISITAMGGLSTAIVNNVITSARPTFTKSTPSTKP